MSKEEGVPAAREVTALQVERVGRVKPGPDPSLPWQIVDEHDSEVLEVSDYLRHLTAGDFSPASVKSYAQALLRWLRPVGGRGGVGPGDPGRGAGLLPLAAAGWQAGPAALAQAGRDHHHDSVNACRVAVGG